jgi:hypothetical protein
MHVRSVYACQECVCMSGVCSTLVHRGDPRSHAKHRQRLAVVNGSNGYVTIGSQRIYDHARVVGARVYEESGRQ